MNLLKPLHYAGEQCVYQRGGIEVAATPERWAELQRKSGVALSYGLESHLLTPQEVKAHIPILNEQAILGGYYVPTDADVRGWHCAAALAQASMNAGVEFAGNVEVLNLHVRAQRAGARSSSPTKEQSSASLCCCAPTCGLRCWPTRSGCAFRSWGWSTNWPTPSRCRSWPPTERFITHPILRHQDYSLYYRQCYDGYAVGNYRHTCAAAAGRPPGGRVV